MKGAFSTTVSNAVKSMQPIPLPLTLGDANLLDAASQPPILNGSVLNSDFHEDATEPFLLFPTPTVPTELERNELRKRYVDQHTVPYGMQEGLTKYAPMPKRAGTTIATKSPTPQYPPFPFSIATTYLGAPTVQYTDTAYLTWTTHSIENTVCRGRDPESRRIANISRLPPLLHLRWIRECSNGWSVGRIRYRFHVPSCPFSSAGFKWGLDG